MPPIALVCMEVVVSLSIRKTCQAGSIRLIAGRSCRLSRVAGCDCGLMEETHAETVPAACDDGHPDGSIRMCHPYLERIS